MIFELIAAVVAGVAVAGLALGLRWISRGLLPKWIVPAAAGLGMLSYAIWSEYSWFERNVATQPEGVVVAWNNEQRSLLRPWSYYKPVVTRYSAVDMRTVQRHPNQPDQVMVDILLAARWQSAARIKVLFDCAGRRRADLLGDQVKIAEDGTVSGVPWTALPADDHLLEIACRRS